MADDLLSAVAREARAVFLESAFLAEWDALRSEMMAEAERDGATPADLRQLSEMAARYRDAGLTRIRGLETLQRFTATVSH